MSPTTRLAVSAVSVCALAVPLAGCGAKGDNGASSNVETTSGQVKQVAATGDSIDGFINRVRSGLGDSGSAHLVMTATGSMSGHAVGDVSYGPDGPLAKITGTAPMLGGKDATLIVVKNTVYVSVPGFTPPGKFVTMTKPSHTDVNVKPDDVYSVLRAGIVKVEDLGAEQVGGVATDHVRVHLSPAKAAKAMRALLGDEIGDGMGPGMGPGWGGMGPGMRPHGGMMGEVPSTVVADVWLDGEDHVRQVQAELNGTKVDVDLSEWGEPVDVQAPPATDVVRPRPMGGLSQFRDKAPTG